MGFGKLLKPSTTTVTISKEDFGGREFKFIESESSIDVGYRECPQDTNIDDFFFSFYFADKILGYSQ